MVSLETSVKDSQTLSSIRLPDPAPAKPVRIISAETYPKRDWILLSIAQHSAATFDAYSTRQAVATGATEADPFMRPFANSPGIYAAIQVGPAILDYAAHRMQRSENNFIRRNWWIPQTASTGLYPHFRHPQYERGQPALEFEFVAVAFLPGGSKSVGHPGPPPGCLVVWLLFFAEIQNTAFLLRTTTYYVRLSYMSFASRDARSSEPVERGVLRKSLWKRSLWGRGRTS